MDEVMKAHARVLKYSFAREAAMNILRGGCRPQDIKPQELDDLYERLQEHNWDKGE